MGKLRTANNRRKRAIRQTVVRTHAAAAPIAVETAKANTKPIKAAS